MIKKLLVASSLAACFVVAGCGKNKAVKAFEELADEVCACKDSACAMEAATKLQGKMTELMDEKGTQSDVEAIQAATKKMQGCMESLKK